MLQIRLGGAEVAPLAVPVVAGRAGSARLKPTTLELVPQVREQLTALLGEVERAGVPGEVQLLPRPGEPLNPVYLFGVGTGDEAGWRAAGAAVVRAAAGRHEALAVALPA